MRTRLILAILLLGAAVPRRAGAIGSASKGTAGAQFLKIDPGARPVAMGSAFGGIAEGVYAAHYNPAGLAFLDRVEAGAARDAHFQGITHDYGAIAIPLLSWRDTRRKRNALGTAAFSLTSLSIPDLERRGTVETDAPQGSFGAGDYAYAFSYGAPAGDALALGATLKWIRQTIDAVSGQTAAADGGVLFRRERWSAGAGVRNLGKGVRLGTTADPLPTVLYLGGGWRPAPGWLTAAEIRQPTDDALLFSIGAEFEKRFSKRLSGALRGGFNTANLDAGGLGGVSLGGAVAYKSAEFGIAWAPMGDLGSTFRYSLRVKFGN